MKWRELRKQLGDSLRLRPYAILADSELAPVQSVESKWTLVEITDSPRGVTIRNDELDLQLDLEADHIYNYQSPDTLWLRSQIIIDHDLICLEPVHIYGGPVDSFEIVLPAHDVSHREWTPIHGSGAPSDSRILVFTKLDGHRLWLQPGEVEPTATGTWIHPRVNLHSSRERYVYALAVDEGVVAQVRAFFGPQMRTVPQLQKRFGEEGIAYELSLPKLLNTPSASDFDPEDEDVDWDIS